MRGVRRAVWPLVVTAVFVGVLFAGVFPTRTWLAQRAATASAQERVDVLQAQNRALADRARLLHDDAEIERLAREQYGLVRPGEVPFAILPPPAPERVRKPPPAPSGPSWVAQAWDVANGALL